MYINKLIKKQVMLILATFVLVGALAVTSSFALFEETKSNATDQKMAIGDLDITFTGGSAISITDINPMTDSTALKQTNNTYTWTITNNGTVPYKYTIKMANNSTSTSKLVPHQYIRYSLNSGSAKALGSGQDTPEIETGAIAAGETKNYTLRLWIADASTYKLPNSVLGQEVHLKVQVDGKAGIQTFAETILANNEVKTPLTTPGAELSAYTIDDVTYTDSSSVSSTLQNYYVTYGTGWESNGTKFNLTGTAVTTDTYANSYSSLVGKYLLDNSISGSGSSTAGTMKTTTNLSYVYYVVSATSSSFTYKRISSNKNTTEALLASAEDDYGTSYYFRGSVTNNYVEFANKCWRIVRIGGDNTVKLILHNDNTSNASNPCSSANNSSAAAFAHYSGSTYRSTFNSSDNDNAYVGFMYGTAGSSTYEATHANTNKSTILTNLETWYNNNLKTYESVIDDNVFCNDKNISGSGLGYGTNSTNYMAKERLSTNKTPSLKCNGELSKITSKIGLITADELVYAGYAAYMRGSASYLQENATGTFWWSLSPGIFTGNAATFWIVLGSNADLQSNYTVTNVLGVRSYISLRSSTHVTGEGTSENPYKVVV